MNAPLRSSVSLKQGAKVRKARLSTGIDEVIPDLRCIENKGIPLLFIQASTTIKSPVTILYSHDSDESLGSIREWLMMLAEIFKANIVAWEYPGYSKNTRFSDERVVQHIETVYHFIRNSLNLPSNRIILYAKGAGSGPTLNLAWKLQKTKTETCDTKRIELIAGIVLINPVLQSSSLGFTYYTLQQIRKLTTPTIFMCSTACENRVELMKLANSFPFIRGIHFINCPSLQIEHEKFDEMVSRLNKFIITIFPEYKDVFSGAELLKRKPPKRFENPIDEVRHYLSEIGLEKHTETLVSFGYMNLENLLEIQEIDLDSFDFEDAEKDKLRQFLRDRRAEQAPPQPTQPDVSQLTTSPPERRISGTPPVQSSKTNPEHLPHPTSPRQFRKSVACGTAGSPPILIKSPSRTEQRPLMTSPVKQTIKDLSTLSPSDVPPQLNEVSFNISSHSPKRPSPVSANDSLDLRRSFSVGHDTRLQTDPSVSPPAISPSTGVKRRSRRQTHLNFSSESSSPLVPEARPAAMFRRQKVRSENRQCLTFTGAADPAQPPREPPADPPPASLHTNPVTTRLFAPA